MREEGGRGGRSEGGGREGGKEGRRGGRSEGEIAEYLGLTSFRMSSKLGSYSSSGMSPSKLT